MQQNPNPTHQSPRVRHLERRLTEAFDQLWNDFVDPSDALYDTDGTRWNPVGAGLQDATATVLDEQQLAELRSQCRTLATRNEFAINGHENRVSYIVGSGHRYRVAARSAACRRSEVTEEMIAATRAVIDEFLQENRWHQRQQEIVRRKDRDGECFLRFFVDAAGSVRVRFVEPDQVVTPPSAAGLAHHRLGIITAPDDVETVEAYYVDGQPIDAAEIQHRKANVDSNVRRGLPLFYPVRKNLRRAEKLLRNMSVVAEIQSAIAIIRKHRTATAAGLEQFVTGAADLSVADATGQATHFRRYGPGTILDAAAETDYEFPASGIDAAKFVVVLQAELRAIASRLVMPEFMLTSDASNANYASTMVAEGPAVKMFDRLQHDMLEDDREVIRRVLSAAVDTGRLPPHVLTAIDVQITPPTLATHDRLKDAQADQILVRNGAMTPETMALRHGLEPVETPETEEEA